MPQFIRANRVYFLCLGFFFLLSGVALILIEQGDAILFFNARRAVWSDFLFKYGTQLGEEIAYVGITIILLFFDYRKALLFPLLGVLVTIVSYFSKSIFAQDRPATYFKKLNQLQDLQFIEGIDLHTGATSFPSGHTMSGFALYTLLALLLPKKWWIQISLFSIAFLVGFSRIYLVQHFLRDVYLGAFLGVGIGIVFYQMYIKLSTKKPLQA